MLNSVDYTIFQHEVNGRIITVELMGDNPVYKIDNNEILNQSLNSFVSEAVLEFSGTTVKNGTLQEGTLEHFGSNQNPSIRQNNADDVIISGSGVGGQYKASFDNDADADSFQAFADDLLGKDPTTTKIFDFNGITNSGANTIRIFSNDEIIALNQDLSNGFGTVDSLHFTWSGADTPGKQTTTNLDIFIEEMGILFDGTQLQDGEIIGFGSQDQAQLIGNDLNQVDLGSNGIDGTEIWEFNNQQEAQNFLNFFNSVVDVF